MAEIRLAGQPRDDFGKGASRRLRRDGRVPAVLYGDQEQPRHLSLDGHDLNQALKQPKVILEIELEDDTIPTAPRDVQRHPVRQDLWHIDLVVLNRAEVKARQIEADLVRRAEEAAVENELDPVSVADAASALLAEGGDPAVIVEQAIEQVRADLKAQAEAAAAAAAAEDAAAAAEEAGEGAEGEAAGEAASEE
jgi:large subunit ribosomal protein L25